MSCCDAKEFRRLVRLMASIYEVGFVHSPPCMSTVDEAVTQ